MSTRFESCCNLCSLEEVDCVRECRQVLRPAVTERDCVRGKVPGTALSALWHNGSFAHIVDHHRGYYWEDALHRLPDISYDASRMLREFGFTGGDGREFYSFTYATDFILRKYATRNYVVLRLLQCVRSRFREYTPFQKSSTVIDTFTVVFQGEGLYLLNAPQRHEALATFERGQLRIHCVLQWTAHTSLRSWQQAQGSR